MTELFSWGRFPRRQSRVTSPNSVSRCAELVTTTWSVTPRGLGRSYGDSALGDNVIDTTSLDKFIHFEPDSGLLTVQAGVSLDEILRVFVPRGWFLPVTPGTRFVTVGGAIASDVHGKNHHVEGTFSDHVTRMKILVGTGDVLEVSPSQHEDLFRATCGGMGLTGLILEASFTLKKIQSSYIRETTYKCVNLEEVIRKFEETSTATYSVAWIDCLATGTRLGRSLLMVGEHALEGGLHPHRNRSLRVPFDFPSFLMNKFTMGIFNWMYFHKVLNKQHTKVVPYEPFFYPLDVVQDWNRLYGKNGFVQYQFVIPFDSGIEGLREILTLIAESGKGSFLAVLKVFGEQNSNKLSFPFAGYTLALDFKVEKSLFPLLERLDQAVQKHSGRLYLTKDSRMSEDFFKATYPHWEKFMEVRKQFGASGVFTSDQANRLGLS